MVPEQVGVATAAFPAQQQGEEAALLWSVEAEGEVRAVLQQLRALVLESVLMALPRRHADQEVVLLPLQHRYSFSHLSAASPT